MKAARIQQMKEYIKSHQNVTNEELCEAMGVSMSTLRRDIQMLRQEGVIKQVYGGVTYHESALLTPYQFRNTQDNAGKDRIGKLAAGFIQNGDVIFIDSGTTTPHILKYITAENVTIVTHSAAILERASEYPKLSIFLLPGLFYAETMSVSCPEMLELLESYEVKKAFLAASGLSARGATNNAAWEYNIKKYLADHIPETYLCVTSAKFGVPRIITYCKPEQLTGIISDGLPDEALRQFLSERQVRLIYPKA